MRAIPRSIHTNEKYRYTLWGILCIFYLIKVHEAFPQGLYYVRLKLRVGDEGCVEPIP